MAATDAIRKLDALIAYVEDYNPTQLSPREYQELRNEIADVINKNQCHPILVRLAWHDSGTYDKKSNTGGPRAAQRFDDEKCESKHGANAGLYIARKLLSNIAERWCNNNNTNNNNNNNNNNNDGINKKNISIADLWALAATVAIELAGGPIIPFRFGRIDAKTSCDCVESGRLPDADKKFNHLRDVFYKMGFNDRDIIVLSGAHTLGSCHDDRSGFSGPWTNEPLKFDNQYYKDLLNKKWQMTKVEKTGNPQFETQDKDGTMMLISDMALLDEKDHRAIVQEYAESQDAFFRDFAVVWQRLIELGYTDKQLYTVELPKN